MPRGPEYFPSVFTYGACTVELDSVTGTGLPPFLKGDAGAVAFGSSSLGHSVGLIETISPTCGSTITNAHGLGIARLNQGVSRGKLTVTFELHHTDSRDPRIYLGVAEPSLIQSPGADQPLGDTSALDLDRCLFAGMDLRSGARVSYGRTQAGGTPISHRWTEGAGTVTYTMVIDMNAGIRYGELKLKKGTGNLRQVGTLSRGRIYCPAVVFLGRFTGTVKVTNLKHDEGASCTSIIPNWPTLRDVDPGKTDVPSLELRGILSEDVPDAIDPVPPPLFGGIGAATAGMSLRNTDAGRLRPESAVAAMSTGLKSGTMRLVVAIRDSGVTKAQGRVMIGLIPSGGAPNPMPQGFLLREGCHTLG